MLGNGDPLHFVDGVGQPFGRIHRGLTEIQTQLIRVFQVSFAALLKRPLQQFRDLQPLLLHFLFERGDRLDRPCRLVNPSLAGGDNVGQDQRLDMEAEIISGKIRSPNARLLMPC